MPMRQSNNTIKPHKPLTCATSSAQTLSWTTSTLEECQCSDIPCSQSLPATLEIYGLGRIGLVEVKQRNVSELSGGSVKLLNYLSTMDWKRACTFNELVMEVGD